VGYRGKRYALDLGLLDQADALLAVVVPWLEILSLDHPDRRRRAGAGRSLGCRGQGQRNGSRQSGCQPDDSSCHFGFPVDDLSDHSHPHSPAY
jgi:hypothetical protein